MTIDELSKYHVIKLEIEQIKANLKELDDTTIGSPKISGMPQGSGHVGNPVESLVIKKSKLLRNPKLSRIFVLLPIAIISLIRNNYLTKKDSKAENQISKKFMQKYGILINKLSVS